jgi:hypothetical protein
MRTGWILAGLALGSVLLFGCGDDATRPPESPYSDALTHPDSLINDLMASYREREIEPYANLLARDFKFVFQQDDVTPDIPLGYWNATEDSTGTRHLLESTYVTDIRVALTWPAPVDTTLDGEPVQRVVATVTILDVDQSDGVTLRIVGDRQLFYFRPGRPEFGEDAGRLYLVQWEDLGRWGGIGKGGSAAEGPQAVGSGSWGEIKKAFR